MREAKQLFADLDMCQAYGPVTRAFKVHERFHLSEHTRPYRKKHRPPWWRERDANGRFKSK